MSQLACCIVEEPALPITIVSVSPHCPSLLWVWARTAHNHCECEPALSITIVSVSPHYPSPLWVEARTAHHYCEWEPALPIIIVSGSPHYPSPLWVEANTAHHYCEWEPALPITIVSGSPHCPSPLWVVRLSRSWSPWREVLTFWEQGFYWGAESSTALFIFFTIRRITHSIDGILAPSTELLSSIGGE